GGFTVSLWLPLAMLGLWLGSRLALGVFDVEDSEALAGALHTASESEKLWAALLQALPLVVSFFVACLVSAMLVGRFGGNAGPRQASLGSLVGSAVVLLLAAAAGGFSWVLALASLSAMVVCASAGGWLGGRFGH